MQRKVIAGFEKYRLCSRPHILYFNTSWHTGSIPMIWDSILMRLWQYASMSLFNHNEPRLQYVPTLYWPSDAQFLSLNLNQSLPDI